MFHVLGIVMLQCMIAAVIAMAAFVGIGSVITLVIPIQQMGLESQMLVAALDFSVALTVAIAIAVWPVYALKKVGKYQAIWLLGTTALTLVGVAIVACLTGDLFLLFMAGTVDSCAEWQNYFGSSGECGAFRFYPLLAISLMFAGLLTIGWYQLMKWSTGQLEKMFPEAV